MYTIANNAQQQKKECASAVVRPSLLPLRGFSAAAVLNNGSPFLKPLRITRDRYPRNYAAITSLQQAPGFTSLTPTRHVLSLSASQAETLGLVSASVSLPQHDFERYDMIPCGTRK